VTGAEPTPDGFQVPPDRAKHFYPSNRDRRLRLGLIFPDHVPKFPLPIRPGASAFTIGSCFARNVEEELERHGLTVPTRSFYAPPAEAPNRPNTLLNEFNPATMAQRIDLATRQALPDPATLAGPDTATIDLLLHTGAPVTRARALARRDDIAAVYRHLATADFVVLTLGYIETWVDREADTVLNRVPPPDLRKAFPGRYVYQRMSLDQVLTRLNPAMEQLGQTGAKVVLTVSPVPITRTFEPVDCVVANEFSKAILRIAAGVLARTHAHVDYYPSYEIVRSGGLAAYIEDHVHVREEVVAEVVSHMVQTYSAPVQP
jgi:hypothetical protein